MKNEYNDEFFHRKIEIKSNVLNDILLFYRFSLKIFFQKIIRFLRKFKVRINLFLAILRLKLYYYNMLNFGQDQTKNHFFPQNIWIQSKIWLVISVKKISIFFTLISFQKPKVFFFLSWNCNCLIIKLKMLCNHVQRKQLLQSIVLKCNSNLMQL